MMDYLFGTVCGFVAGAVAGGLYTENYWMKQIVSFGVGKWETSDDGSSKLVFVDPSET